MTLLLFVLLTASSVQAGKPATGERFHTEFGDLGSPGFSGAVFGSADSNWTADKGTLDNLVFNKADSNVVFNLSPADFDGLASCLNSNYPATMHLIDGFGNDQYLVARFWFAAGGVSYVLELSDTTPDPEFGPGWSGPFPPFSGELITRTAESWEVRTTSKRAKSACTGSGEFSDPVEFTLELLSNN